MKGKDLNSNLVIRGSDVAKGTKMFWFSNPMGLTFRAGQSIDVTLPSGLMHPYSIASSPQNTDEFMIATRMRDSAFKKELDALEPGDGVQIDGPFGSFFLHENAARPAVFLAGGIGVTPFYSMVQDAVERDLPHSIYMIFGNKTREDAPFIENLEALAAKHDRFKLKNVIGERINAEMVKSFVPIDQHPIYYMAGPQGMVTAMRELLNGMGVSNDDIRFEEFSGY